MTGPPNLFGKSSGMALKASIGYMMRPRVSGRAYLDRKLEGLGIAEEAIPDAMRDEIVTSCLRHATGVSGIRAIVGAVKGSAWRTAFVEGLDGNAVIIRSILSGEESYMNTSMHEQMLKYGVLDKE